MKNVRHSVFETNSSSTHSFSIFGNNETLDTIIPNDENAIDGIVNCEFGWGVEDFDDPLTKMAYLLTCALEGKSCFYNKNNAEFTMDDIKANEHASLIAEIVFQHTGAVSFGKNLLKSVSKGYIDHQSEGVVMADLICSGKDDQTREEIRNFIFSPNVILHIDHDNH